MADDIDVVIVGSGFAGSLIANELAKQHKKIVILEAGDGVPPNINDYMDRFYKASMPTAFRDRTRPRKGKRPAAGERHVIRFSSVEIIP